MRTALLNLIMILFYLAVNSQTFVQMEKVNGVYLIPCKVNGIDMKFIFDTGASDISISKTEANFLIKQGLLKESDILGTQKYRIADGSISEGTKIIIREIKINDIFIKNVNATVIDNVNAPLLFGQSALSKFGRFEIENDILRIYSKENKNDFEFLGIDLTKSINEFGLSRLNLDKANPVVGIPFDDCEVSKNHMLKDFGFEKQLVFFNKNGRISLIGLQKKPKVPDQTNQEKYSKDFFEKLYITISTKFGSSESKMSNSAKWEGRYFELMIQVDPEYNVDLLYIPKVSVNHDMNLSYENSEKDFKKIDKNDPEYLEELASEMRIELANIIQQTYEINPIDKRYNLTSQVKNKILYINVESPVMDISPKSYTRQERQPLIDFELSNSKTLAFRIYKEYIFLIFKHLMKWSDESTLKLQCDMWDEIVFDFYYSYMDGSNSTKRYSFSSEEMLATGVPITKKNFDYYFE